MQKNLYVCSEKGIEMRRCYCIKAEIKKENPENEEIAKRNEILIHSYFLLESKLKNINKRIKEVKKKLNIDED